VRRRQKTPYQDLMCLNSTRDFQKEENLRKMAKERAIR